MTVKITDNKKTKNQIATSTVKKTEDNNLLLFPVVLLFGQANRPAYR